MSKEINFMRKDLLTEEEMHDAIVFLAPLFENDGEGFKKALQENTAFLESNRFTIIQDRKNKKQYKIMGNCIGPVLYVKEITPL